MSRFRKWTNEEDEVIYNTIKDHPQNLKANFMALSDRLNRTPGAIMNHWYTKVSRDSRYCAFILISGQHRTINRKNGDGEPCTPSLFRRVLHLLHIDN